MTPRMRLARRHALITGGGRGIGRAIALAFAREGADVALASRTIEDLERVAAEVHPLGRPCVVVPGDVSDEVDVSRIVAVAHEQLNGLDILVNCAGVSGPIGPIDTVDATAWWEAVRVNLLGTFLCIRATLGHLRRSSDPAIINLSGGGATSPRPNFSAYAASKAAVVRLTETLHHEFAGEIPIYAIAPGAVNTRMLDDTLAAGERAGTAAARQAREQEESGGTSPELAAGLAIFLAAGGARSLSGRLISAVWDPWQEWESDPTALSSLGKDVYSLRRIVPTSN